MTVHDTFPGSPGALRWPTLFSPLRIGRRTVPNRFVSTPHATGWGHGGLLTRREVEYHVRKAAGGTGLVMTFGSAAVDPDSAASYGSISLWDERNDDLLRELAERVHEHGALIMSQMTHMGRRGNSLLSGVALKAVSDLPESVHREVPAVFTEDELAVLAGRFGHAARRLMDLGWDGAEVTSFGGHLIEQFFDPNVNTRTDRYGGSLENRVRFGREALQAVRQSTSGDFLVGFRMTGDHMLPRGGMSPGELVEVAQAMTAGGTVDLLSISISTGYTSRATSAFVPGDELPENVAGPPGGRMRRATGVPVLVAGRILNAEMAERALTGNGVDLVATTRALIADPDLPRKSAAGITPRPCISLNEGCIGRLYQGLPMWCSVNPSIREPELDLLAEADVPLSGPPRRIVVIGAGVAGAEAAHRAAERGSEVVLLERTGRLGGRAALAGQRPGRERWALYLDWLTERLKTTGVDVRLGAEPTVADVLALRPDIVVLATGSVPRWPAWAANAPVPVIDADDVIASTPQPEGPGKTVMLVDEEGGFVAATAAEALASAGWLVRIATSFTSVAAHVDPTQAWPVRRRLKQAGIEFTESVTPEHDGTAWSLIDLETDQTRSAGPVDLVVLAGPRRSLDELSDGLTAAQPSLEVVRIGDALAPRNLLDAAAEGARAAAACSGRTPRSTRTLSTLTSP
jgi:2,4-dienoyl-CoA reductase-like NADH-dependent reductase (Old Yellow Enzyme family)